MIGPSFYLLIVFVYIMNYTAEIVLSIENIATYF